MLRKRIISVLTFVDGVLFRSKLFVPDYRYGNNFVDTSYIDEVLLLDITRPDQSYLESRQRFLAVVESFASRSVVPMTVGGGVRSVKDVQELLSRGADKVLMNTVVFDEPKVLEDVAKRYGSQCAVVGIDARREPDGSYRVWRNFGTFNTGLDPADWAEKCVNLGAGEIVLQSIDKDGSLEGYDLELISRVSRNLKVPLVISGGCGNWSHFAEALEMYSVDGAGTSNIYHFTETSIKSAKQFLRSRGVSVR